MSNARGWRDAPAGLRCVAVITLRDKSLATCGRRYSEDILREHGWYLCRQHGRIHMREEARNAAWLEAQPSPETPAKETR